MCCFLCVLQVPAAAPTSTLPTRPDSLKRSSKPVVLIRDTNCWCPFCERVSPLPAQPAAICIMPFSAGNTPNKPLCLLQSMPMVKDYVVWHSALASTLGSSKAASTTPVRCADCWSARLGATVPVCLTAQVWLALEEKGIPYDCVLIELYNKPAWYKELVPTSLVPAVVSAHTMLLGFRTVRLACVSGGACLQMRMSLQAAQQLHCEPYDRSSLYSVSSLAHASSFTFGLFMSKQQCSYVFLCVLQSFSEDGSIVWESKDILLDLERRFPQSVPLLPTDEEEQQAVMDFMGELEECGLDKHGKHSQYTALDACVLRWGKDMAETISSR